MREMKKVRNSSHRITIGNYMRMPATDMAEKRYEHGRYRKVSKLLA